MQSKSVNNVYKLLQLLGDFPDLTGALHLPDPLLGLRPWTAPQDFRPPDPLGYNPSNENSRGRYC